LGQRIPAAHCAEGRVLLAFAEAPPAEAQKPGGARRKSQTAAQSGLQTELAGIRSRGFAIDNEDTIPGICAIAAPFFGADNDVAGAIGIAGPAQRLGRRKLLSLLPLLTQSTGRISQRLGASRSTMPAFVLVSP
jgi:DNA-binding IclR family transcriptional regulator